MESLCTFDSLWSSLFSVACVGNVMSVLVFAFLIPALRDGSSQIATPTAGGAGTAPAPSAAADAPGAPPGEECVAKLHSLLWVHLL